MAEHLNNQIKDMPYRHLTGLARLIQYFQSRLQETLHHPTPMP